MKKDQLLEDLRNMEEIMMRTSSRSDIWQDRYIYWIAKAINDILTDMYRKKDE